MLNRSASFNQAEAVGSTSNSAMLGTSSVLFSSLIRETHTDLCLAESVGLRD